MSKRRNPIARVVRALRPKVVPDRRAERAERHERGQVPLCYLCEGLGRIESQARETVSPCPRCFGFGTL